MRMGIEKINVLSRDVEAIITVSENERYPFEVESKLLLLFYSQLVLLPMCEQSQDTNVAADEVLQLRLRPGYGTVGKPIKLACNYFPLIKLQKGDIMVNRYHIDIQHPRLNDDNRDIFWAYAVKRSDIFGDPFKLAYDGMNTLFTVDKLHLKQVSEKADTEKFSFKTARENKPSELSILIKFTGLVHLDFRNAEAGSLDERKKGPIQFLDILFAQGRSSPIF
ncbi:eukaryotic translation initiation factor 2C 1, partial [Trichinella spiralis]|uniref:eukaryotic translation initiation factor 2C 1 n=1 Tax=Trichinella spiralis TaxID=6334 RepID=UPI0001EFD897